MMISGENYSKPPYQGRKATISRRCLMLGVGHHGVAPGSYMISTRKPAGFSRGADRGTDL